MSDIARRVGLSRSAVSFALNNENQVSEETRLRVVAAAAELGYRPNASARSLASSSTELFGLVTDIVTTPFAGDLIAGAQDAFWSKGKSLLIVGTDHPDRPEKRSLEMMLEHRVGGIMVATTYNRPIKVPKALDGTSVILVHCFDAAGLRPSVVPDEELGGYTATKMLLDAGRRSLGMINLDPDLPAARGRHEGYLRALGELGIQPRPSVVVSAGADADGGYEAAKQLLSTQRLDGLFCANDRLAMGAYQAAGELGLSIPQDISVVGFDNQEVIARFLRPALSTVALPFREMGRIGAELLMQSEAEPAHPEDGRPVAQVVVPPPPVPRASI
ncbi:LacI family DNA-binding transcriptional regulator [Propionicimonas sp.]|uniref:LacI family DNA-binding transcriptional regulator n=1 Tax=Propionicimonas sp. TaxID=1955623 RepID=UPI0039E6C151